MIMSQIRITVVECLKVYSGTAKSGNDYTVGTWKVKGVLDGKEFLVTAFNKWHEILDTAKDGIILDCSLTISCKEWDGKWFNDVSISDITLPGGQQPDLPKNDLPIEEKPPVFAGGDEDDGLPF